MARTTGSEWADKLSRRLKSAGEDIRKGVARVTQAPGVKAAAKKDKMLTNLTQSVNDGTWSSQVAKVTLPEWQASMNDKGINRISQGLDSAMAKMSQTGEQLMAAVDATKAEVDRMSDSTLEDRIAKSAAWQRGMAKRKLRRPGA